MTTAPPVFSHLTALTDERGLFEHTLLDVPRPEHGYCLDDAARALIVVLREPAPTPATTALSERYLRFVESAIAADGRARNRMTQHGHWADQPGVGDWWGRAVWALGVAAVTAQQEDARRRARLAFSRAASARSSDLRPMAYAALGAAAVAGVETCAREAVALLRDAAAALDSIVDDHWHWPEHRLRYANGVLPDAVLAAGSALGDSGLVDRGLRMLRFLVDVETADGHLSVTGVAGRGPDDAGPQFDQQPIEVATIAEACVRAFALTGDESWKEVVGMAWAWFLGDNDTGVEMFDLATGAGYDGLTPVGRNENRGAESTLAALSTYQHARRLRLTVTVPA